MAISASAFATDRGEWSRTPIPSRTDWWPSVSGLQSATILRMPDSWSRETRPRTVASLTSSSVASSVYGRRPSRIRSSISDRSVWSIIRKPTSCSWERQAAGTASRASTARTSSAFPKAVEPSSRVSPSSRPMRVSQPSSTAARTTGQTVASYPW